MSLKNRAVLLFIFVVFCLSAQGQSDPEWVRIEFRLERSLSGSVEEKRTALAEIRNLKAERSSRLAIPALSDSDEIVRATAASSVIFVPARQAAQLLLPLLGDKKAFVRKEAAYALEQIGTPDAAPALVRLLLRDKDLEVRSAAAAALGSAGSISDVPALLQVLRSKATEDMEFLRRSAARAVGHIAQRARSGERTSTTPQNFLPEQYKYVIASTQPDLVARFASVTSVLTAILQNDSEAADTRREAAFALGAIGNPNSAAVLNNYVADPDPYLAQIAREALLALGSVE